MRNFLFALCAGLLFAIGCGSEYPSTPPSAPADMATPPSDMESGGCQIQPGCVPVWVTGHVREGIFWLWKDQPQTINRLLLPNVCEDWDLTSVRVVLAEAQRIGSLTLVGPAQQVLASRQVDGYYDLTVDLAFQVPPLVRASMIEGTPSYDLALAVRLKGDFPPPSVSSRLSVSLRRSADSCYVPALEIAGQPLTVSVWNVVSPPPETSVE